MMSYKVMVKWVCLTCGVMCKWLNDVSKWLHGGMVHCKLGSVRGLESLEKP